MYSVEAINCPVCESIRVENILHLNCGNFDGSALYQNANINTCHQCGHIYNELNATEVEGLINYYNYEYAPINMNANYKTGNMPGGEGHDAFCRYTQLFDFISPYINTDSKVLDIGCAMGGLLDYLHNNGVNHLSGIDLTAAFVNHVRLKGKYNIRLGSAESIPFDDSSFDLLIINQVIEHLVTPVNVFKEAKRVLVNGGILFLGVPDASRYDEMCSFDFYWLLIRDHIQHFDIAHLKLLAAMEGFELLHSSKLDNLVLSAELVLPNLNLIFRHTGKNHRLDVTEDCFTLKRRFDQYIAYNYGRLNETNRLIESLILSQDHLYAWGIGSEFLYLLENTRLRKCNIAGLIDVNPYKQDNFTVKGLSIAGPHILDKTDNRSKLLITAMAYKKAIIKHLQSINFKGQIVE